MEPNKVFRHESQREKDTHKVGYYVVIPAKVLMDASISDKSKILYGHISGLIKYSEKFGIGYCWASNSYFASGMNSSKPTISRLVSELKRAGHIDTHLTYKPKSKEVSQRYITIGVIPKPSEKDIRDFFNEESKERDKTNLLYMLQNPRY